MEKYLFAAIIACVGIFPAEAGQVMIRTESGRWTVIKPDGSALDIASSNSSGFKEAVEYSVSIGEPLKLEGGPNCVMSWAQTVEVPPLPNNTYWNIEPCEISFNGSGDAIVFDTIIHANIIWRAHLQHLGDGAGHSTVHFYPRNRAGELGPFIVDSHIEWFRATYLGRGVGNGVQFSAHFGAITHTSIELVEVEGRRGQFVHMGDGIRISHPGGGQRFTGNSISVQRLQGFSGAGFRVGENIRPASAGLINGNRFSAYIAPMHRNAAAFMSWGQGDLAQLHISNEIGPFATGIHLFEGASSGIYIVPVNDGEMKVVDNSKSRNSLFLSPQMGAVEPAKTSWVDFFREQYGRFTRFIGF